jgi:NADH-quinone oxidoreductase subunit C
MDSGSASRPQGRSVSNPVDAGDLLRLQEEFGDANVLVVGEGPPMPTAVVERSVLPQVLRRLKAELGYQLLRSITAVDYVSTDPRFQVVYHLAAIPRHMVEGDPAPREGSDVRQVRLRVGVPAEDLRVPSATDEYPTANWHEREVWDMFGVRFDSHPDLRRILLPDEFDTHPLRKDEPLVYEEVAFSHNAASIHGRKPRAED